MGAELVFSVLRDGSYRKHVEGLRLKLSRAMTTTITRLKGVGVVPWIEPEAGMFIWGRLPDGLDAAELAKQALQEGIMLAPGNAFSLSQSASGYLRFNVAQCGDERLFAFLRTALSSH